MSISNMNNTHLTAAQVTAINNSMTALEAAMAPLTVNLTPEERKKFGRINEENKLIVDKAQSFYTDSPQLARPDVNWPEFLNDYNSRKVMEKFINRMDGLKARFVDAKTLHDFDNYSNAIEDYGYTSFMASSNTPGYQAKFAEMKQFFTKGSKGGGGTPGNGNPGSGPSPDNPAA